MIFKIGDKVQIVKKVTKQEGWDNSWSEDMNIYVNNGKIYTIKNIYSHGIRFKEDDNFAWPSNCFKLVNKALRNKQEAVAWKCKYLWNTSNWVKNNPKQAY